MLSTKSIQQFRSETPYVDAGIHLNNAGAALMPKIVVDAIHGHIELETQLGGYEAAKAVQAIHKTFYTELAQFLNTAPPHIAWVANATDGFNKALSAIPFRQGDTILTTNEDYASNFIAFFQLQKQLNLKIIRIATSPKGELDLQNAEQLIKQLQPKLVAITHIPTSSGLIQPVEAVGQLCAKYDCWYLVDACQSAGQLPLNVQQIQCDFLSASFRKFMRGPRGGGFLYVSAKALEAGLEPKFMDLHSAEWDSPETYRPLASAKRFEHWERSYALVQGARAAVQYINQHDQQAMSDTLRQRAAECRSLLQEIQGIRVLDQGSELGGIVTFHPEDWKAAAFQQRLEATKIRFSISYQPYARFDLMNKNVDWVARFSPHYYNTAEEIELAVKQVGLIIG